jgi:hypothetical protein
VLSIGDTPVTVTYFSTPLGNIERLEQKNAMRVTLQEKNADGSEKFPMLNGRVEFEKQYTIYIAVRRSPPEGKYKAIVEQIDGLMTTDEAAKKQSEAEESERKAREEQAKSLAKGYTYHGVSEDDQSALLFDGGALVDGHAYYVSGFMVAAGGSTAGVTTQTLLGRLGDPKSYHVIEYVSQTVRGEVVSAGQTIFGTLPVTVVIAGGKPPLRIPVVLGLVK